jgi:hypothetical protein
MEPVQWRQLLSPALLLVQQQAPHTTTPIARNPIIKLLVDRHTRRIRPPAQTPIEGCFFHDFAFSGSLAHGPY